MTIITMKSATTTTTQMVCLMFCGDTITAAFLLACQQYLIVTNADPDGPGLADVDSTDSNDNLQDYQRPVKA